MIGYTLALFLHVLGALGLAVSLGLEWVDQRRLAARVGGPSLGILLLAGLYLTATRWGGTPWIGLALLSLVALGALGAAGARAPRAIGRASLRLRVAIVVGVVFLMTAKPDLGGALAATAVAALAGIGWAFSARPARDVHDLSTPAVQR